MSGNRTNQELPHSPTAEMAPKRANKIPAPAHVFRNKTLNNGVKVIVAKRWFALVIISVIPLALVLAWMERSGKIEYLTLDRHSTIEVNGVSVQGEILSNRVSAIVTRRDQGKQRSYALYFEGDVDFTGDMGFVVDCGPWVAPNLPVLPVTRSYPPCKRLFGDVSDTGRWPLIYKGTSMQFALKDQTIITVRH